MSYARVYDFSIPAGGTIYLEVPGNYYKIISSTGNLGIKRDSSNVLQPMFAGRGEKGAVFQRLALNDLSGSINSGQILIASDSEMVDSTFQAVGAIAVRPEGNTGFWVDTANAVANTPLTIFTPASNVNGALVLQASTYYSPASAGNDVICHGTAAPATIASNAPILMGGNMANNGATPWNSGVLNGAAYIPAGHGLYHISSIGTASHVKFARYKML